MTVHMYIHFTAQHSWRLGSKSDFKHEATPKFLSVALHVEGLLQLPVGIIGLVESQFKN